MMVEDDEGGALYGEDEASSNGFGFGVGCTWSGVLEERERVERAWRNSKVLGLGFRGWGQQRK